MAEFVEGTGYETRQTSKRNLFVRVLTDGPKESVFGSCPWLQTLVMENAKFSSVYEPGIFSFLLFFRAGV